MYQVFGRKVGHSAISLTGPHTSSSSIITHGQVRQNIPPGKCIGHLFRTEYHVLRVFWLIVDLWVFWSVLRVCAVKYFDYYSIFQDRKNDAALDDVSHQLLTRIFWPVRNNFIFNAAIIGPVDSYIYCCTDWLLLLCCVWAVFFLLLSVCFSATGRLWTITSFWFLVDGSTVAAPVWW